MNTEKRNYRNAFMLALLVNVVLLAVAGFWWWKSHKPAPEDKSVAASPQSSSQVSMNANAAPASETPLAPVQLTPQRMQSIGVKIGTAQWKTVESELRVTGSVDADERRISYVQTRFPGWIRKVYANATYQYIGKGQPLFTIYSPDLVTTEQEYLLARKNSESMKTSTVTGVASGAQTLLEAARARLAQWEVPASEIEKLETTGRVITDLTFNSPASGYVTEKNALPNMYVQPETRLYTVVDLSTVWIYAQVFQTDLGRIKPGDAAEVTIDAYPGKTFRGRVETILPQVDMNTRTARVRLVFANPGLKLTPGMYVNVLMKLPLGRQLVVPASAVFHSGTRQVVFISHGTGQFEPREVQTGLQVGEQVVITKGIQAGDALATSANFLIDSESQLQAAAGAFIPPPPGAGGAAAMNAATADVTLTTEPSPPHKGENVFRIKLLDNNGSPITGAQVTVTFFMPAMPAMGMSAMKTVVNCSDKGNGIYEGSGELESGGTWQVTITAQQNGRTLAGKQLNVNATGGM
ncbi:MAG: efflux RND transporter periplasmic adaptor subunit [Candidatus Angelobacter sp. Gp1-AA117]|nr:MAG: efflux RND transporter periplasmic adaptor subunit [Candidatus Angelobacter sp. Gp1-AA117]